MQNMDDYSFSDVVAQSTYEIESGTSDIRKRLMWILKKALPEPVGEGMQWMLAVYDNGNFINIFFSGGAHGFQWHLTNGELKFIGAFDYTFALNDMKLTRAMKKKIKELAKK